MKKFEEMKVSADALERESLTWVNRVLSGSLTQADVEALTDWRAQSPAHEQQFAEAIRFRRMVRSAVEGRRAQATVAQTQPAPRRARPDRNAIGRPAVGRNVIGRRALVGGALAASCAGGYLVLNSQGAWPGFSALAADYRTGVGEQRSVAPTPGVAVELNALTEVNLRTEEGVPGIELLSGEAEVTARRRAFAVIARRGQVMIGDGRINVRQMDNSVCVTCLEGGAEVRHLAGRVALSAGHQVVFTNKTIDQPRLVDLAIVSSWRKGLLIFRDAPLQHVVDELNRYRKGKIVLLDGALASRPVYGVFQVDQLGRAVEQIERLTGARAMSLPGGIVVLN